MFTRWACRTSELLGVEGELRENLVEAYDDYVGPGYGQPTDDMVDAIAMLAAEEGIFLDPVYSGKGMAGLIGLIRNGVLKKGETVVFIHTGGSGRPVRLSAFVFAAARGMKRRAARALE